MDADRVGADQAQDTAAEKVAQVLLTFDGLAFIPVITAAVVGARLTGSVREQPRPTSGHVIVAGLGNVGTADRPASCTTSGVDVVCVDKSETRPGSRWPAGWGCGW